LSLDFFCYFFLSRKKSKQTPAKTNSNGALSITHLILKKDIISKGFSAYKNFDSARGLFTEGCPAFPGAGIQKKNHIQICIRNNNCIKGFFLPRKLIKFP